MRRNRINSLPVGNWSRRKAMPERWDRRVPLAQPDRKDRPALRVLRARRAHKGQRERQGRRVPKEYPDLSGRWDQRGPQGPAGPGNVMVVATTSATTSITSNCTNYSGGTVTVNVTVGQTVEVVGTVWLLINHTAGIRDHGRVVVGTSSTDCNGGSSYYWVPFTVSPTLASDNVFDLVVPVRGVFVAPTTGSVTYYLNALVDSTSPNVNFWYANLAAHVY